MDEEKKILKLAAEIASTDLTALEERYLRRLQILDSQIEALRSLEGAYSNKLADMEGAINHLKAVCKVCSRLNILCLENKADAGKTRQPEGPQKGNGNRDDGKITVNISKAS